MKSSLEMPDELSQILAGMKTKISQLEARVQRLQDKDDERVLQEMYEENEQSIELLGRIFKIDDSKHYDPKELEGMLADYSDSQSSVDLIRAMRDGDDEDDY